MTDAQRYQKDRDDAILHHWRTELETHNKLQRALAHYDGLLSELRLEIEQAEKR